MAIAVISTASVQESTGTSTSMTLGPFTVPDPNALLIVAFGADSTTIVDSTLNWDSSGANTPLVGIAGAQSGHWCRLLYLLNPSTGTHSVALHFAAPGAWSGSVGAVYSGIDSTTPLSTAKTSTFGGSDTWVISTAIASNSSNIIVSALTVNTLDSTDVTAQGAGTVIVASTNSGSGAAIMLLSNTPGSASVQSGFSWIGAQSHGFIAVEINAAAGGAAGVSYRPVGRSLLGVGR